MYEQSPDITITIRGSNICICVKFQPGELSNYIIKLKEKNSMNEFCKSFKVELLGAKMNKIIDIKSKKAVIKFRFDTTVDHSMINIITNTLHEHLATEIYNQLNFQALKHKNKLQETSLQSDLCK